MEEPPHIIIGLKEIFLKMEEISDRQQNFCARQDHFLYRLDEMHKRQDTQEAQVKTLYDRPYIPPSTVRATFMVVGAFGAIVVAIVALFVK